MFTFWIMTLPKKRVISDAVIKVVVMIPTFAGLSLIVIQKLENLLNSYKKRQHH